MIFSSTRRRNSKTIQITRISKRFWWSWTTGKVHSHFDQYRDTERQMIIKKLLAMFLAGNTENVDGEDRITSGGPMQSCPLSPSGNSNVTPEWGRGRKEDWTRQIWDTDWTLWNERRWWDWKRNEREERGRGRGRRPSLQRWVETGGRGLVAINHR